MCVCRFELQFVCVRICLSVFRAARHGLKLSGKLKRIAQQDRVLAESLQLGKGEKGLSETLEREGPSSPRKRTRESRQAEIATQARRKAKKRKL